MWLVRKGIANILSLPQLEYEVYRVTYDTVTDWVIHVPDGPLMTHGTKIVLKLGRGCVRVYRPYTWLILLTRTHRSCCKRYAGT